MVPLGDSSLENAVLPAYASNVWLPELTAEKLELTPLPQERVPLDTPHVPLEDESVNELGVPLRV